MKYKVYRDKDAPEGWGVQAIVHEDPNHGWTVTSHGDYYIRREDRWTAVDLAGMLDFVVNELKVVEVGRTISNVEFKAIFQQALDDKDFAQKGGYYPGEPRP